MRIAFLHPDLCVGGAQQLIVYMAMALQRKKHDVVIYTLHYDPKIAYAETYNGTLKVEVINVPFPRAIFGRCIALCSAIQFVLAALYIMLGGATYDICISDQVSACIPVFRLFGKKAIYYCHHPDTLMDPNRKSKWKKPYRIIMDLVEELTIGCSNKVFVNSEYTQEKFYETFHILRRLKFKTEILNPAIDVTKFDELIDKMDTAKVLPQAMEIGGPYFLSFNRYDVTKNLELVLKCFAEYKKMRGGNMPEKMVLAGGFEYSKIERRGYPDGLKKLAQDLGIGDDVLFFVNVNNDTRAYLLKNALACLYTPLSEHFGIVPLEAMYYEKPVLAINNAGPKETIVDKVTGFLMQNNPEEWGRALYRLSDEKGLAKKMGRAGKQRVIDKFGLDAFTEKLNYHVLQITA